MISFRGIFSLGVGDQQAQGGTNNAPTARAPWDTNDQLWLSANNPPNNASAPNTSGQFGRQGSIQFSLPQEINTLGVGNGGPIQGPLVYIISQHGEEGQGN
jgi:hypothetical protein